mmetsp:Transcript_7490/g.16197  ORF Transcript_7490/g.16197 Transcript_7490/m.16197 type:complete len:102 (-) Transcript_7490:252-557(-)
MTDDARHPHSDKTHRGKRKTKGDNKKLTHFDVDWLRVDRIAPCGQELGRCPCRRAVNNNTNNHLEEEERTGLALSRQRSTSNVKRPINLTMRAPTIMVRVR